MAADRPFPASARRLADARRAGLVAWSPALVAGGAIAGGAIAVALLGRAWVGAAGAGITRGAAAARSPHPVDDALAFRGGTLLDAVLALAAPAVLLIAAVALAGHLAQTRSPWLPRRRSRRLPAVGDDAGRRAGSALLDLARALAVAAIAAAVIGSAAATLAAHVSATPRTTGALAGALAGTVLAAAAAAAIAFGLLDWLERGRRLRADLAMSARDVRDERRESESDPRWRRARADRVRGDDDDGVRRALVLLVAGDHAAALAWHPRWQPVPLLTAAATGRAAARLIALARRHHVAVHHDPALAPALATLGAGRLVPERLHGDVARVIVAIER